MRIEQIGNATLINADCRVAMQAMDENSVDAIVCDPPYGIGFMGKAWDSDFISAATKKRTAAKAQPLNPNGTARKNPRNAPSENAGAYDFSVVGNTKFQLWTEEWARDALRVLKLGGHLIVFSGPRTYHRMVCGIEDAGFAIRDQIFWVFGSGFPKSHNLHGDWEGWGTALKPAHEPICVARKPLIGTVAANVQQYGTGGLNIDGCRVGVEERTYKGSGAQPHKLNAHGPGDTGIGYMDGGGKDLEFTATGRWPANLIHDGSEEVLACFPDSKGQIAPSVEDGEPQGNNIYSAMNRGGPHHIPRVEQDKTAARFFYCAKASKADRNEGCGELPDQVLARSNQAQAEAKRGNILHDATSGYNKAPVYKNGHPTVKPTELMRYLCRLVTPPGGTVLDPFMGSGSTGKAAIKEGFKFIGVELDEEHGYFDIACARVRSAVK